MGQNTLPDASMTQNSIAAELAELIGNSDTAERFLGFFSPEQVVEGMRQCNNEIFRRLVPRELAPHVFSWCANSETQFLDNPQKVIDECQKGRRMAAENRRRQHTVPRFFLERFATCNDSDKASKLNVYVRGETTCKQITVDNFCVRNHFYSFRDDSGNRDNSVEIGLSLTEGIAARIIAKLVELRQVLSESERHNLCFFIADMWMRTPAYRERAHALFKSMTNDFLHGLIADERRLGASIEEFNADNDKSLTSQEIAEAIRLGDVKIEPSEAMLLTLTICRAERVAPLVDGMNWTILEAPQGSQFVCSDVPVVLFTPVPVPKGEFVGWGTPGLEVTLPLSPQLCLFMSRRVGPQHTQVTAETADKISKRTVIAGHTFVFSKYQDARISNWLSEENNLR